MTLMNVLHDPSIFAEPFTFRPERWIDDKAKVDKLDQYLVAFGKGSRSCIGMKDAGQRSTDFEVVFIQRRKNLIRKDATEDSYEYESQPAAKGNDLFHPGLAMTHLQATAVRASNSREIDIYAASDLSNIQARALEFNHIRRTIWSGIGLGSSPTSPGSKTSYERITAANLLGSHFGVPGITGSYDYVIVGGGTAGLTLARRLAADTSITVAVIEAGGLYELDNGNFSQIPADASYWVDGSAQSRNPLVDWYQFTEPQPKWADLVADQSYAFDQFLPYFEKSVTFNPPSADRPMNSTAKYDPTLGRQSGGPVQLGYPSWVNGISSWIARSLTSLGVPELPGLISGRLLGWSYVAETLDPTTQTRSSSETSYLRQALEQTTNLQVYKSTLAKKILFDGSKQATGVQVSSGGFEYLINANKEVIVSAGVFRSPQLLMVSGIGPQAMLEAQGITVISDRAGVGQNMFDHVLLGSVYAVDLVTHSQLTTDPKFLAAAAQEYNEQRTGILTNVGGDLLGFEKLPKNATSSRTRSELDATFGEDWPDIELLFFDGNLISQSTDSRNYASSLAGLVAPFSRGNVSINSTDTSDNPIVSPNWLLDVRDQEVAIAGFKRARQIFQTSAIQPIITGTEAFPGRNVTSDEDILAAIKQSAASIDHAACTCAMGKSTDPAAVVDSHASVIGVKGLRVVDASAFPILPPGHPQGTVYALAEKIADDILGTLGSPSIVGNSSSSTLTDTM
ncbi:MAG: hypothetical protein Q9222_002639 [Ikaeria aurantiellina]